MNQNNLSEVKNIKISLIDEFPNHPFKVKDDVQMVELTESIKNSGVLLPVLVRPKEGGRYEMISGHRRMRASELAGNKTIKASGKPIEGVVFGLFKSDAQEFNEKTAVLTATTDKNGTFEFNGVPYGSYFIKELKAADGYLENGTLYALDIFENEQVVEYDIKNDRIPELKTTATVNGKKTIEKDKTIDIYDIVEYKHLVPGNEYTIKGILMNKKTGKPLLINGKTVTAEITFVPKEPSGTVELVFKFNSKYLKNDTDIVVFERLFKDGAQIASHCDLKDKGQTVTITMPKPKPQTKVPDTGDNLDKRTIYTMAAASALAILVIVYNLLRKRKKSDKEDDKHEH